MQFIKSKTGIAIVSLIGAFLFGYFLLTGVFGDTRIALTLFSNPDLNRGLIAHYTFDAAKFDTGKTASDGSPGDTGWKTSSATGDDYNQWSTPSSVDASDNFYASETTQAERQDWYNFSFSVPNGVTIDGIEVRHESAMCSACSTNDIIFDLSWDGGTSYTATTKLRLLTITDTSYTEGSVSDTWGRTWSDTEFSDTNFRLRAEFCNNCSSILKGSLLLGADGVYRQIEDFKVGENILSYNTDLNIFISNTLTFIKSHPSDEIYIINNELFVTANELIWVKQSGKENFDWVSIDKINVSDIILHEEIRLVEEVPITSIKGQQGNYTVYTISAVEPYNNYWIDKYLLDPPSSGVGIDLLEARVSYTTPSGVATTTAYNSISSSNDATGSSTEAIGNIGQGTGFNGVDEFLDAGNIGSASTVAFWIRRDGTGAEKLINIDGTDQIEINSSNVVVATSFPGTTVIYVDGSTDSAVINDNDWHHIAITDTTGVYPTTFEMGRVGTGYFDGKMDDVRIYNRVLSAKEVKRLYELGATTKIAKTITTNPNLTRTLVKHLTFDTTSFDDFALNTGRMLWATTTDPTSIADTALAITSIGTNIYVTGYCDGCGSAGLDAHYTYKIDSSNGDMLWATTTDPSNGDDQASAITSDGTNIYVTGYTDNDSCGGSGIDQCHYTYKIDASNGDMLWATTTDPTGNNDIAQGITSDGTNVYVTGYCTGCGSAGSAAHYTYKIDASNGDMLWATTTSPTGDTDIAQDITSDGTNVYVTGYCTGCGSAGLAAHYTYKIDASNGDMLWATTTDPTGNNDIARDITSDGTNVYVTGYCFDCGSQGSNAHYTYKIDASNGDMLWATTTDPSNGADQASAITSDGTNIYVTGYTDNDSCGGSGIDQCHYTYKIDASNGDMLWATTTDPTSGSETARAITSIGTNVYVTGYCSGCGSAGGNAHYTYKIDARTGASDGIDITGTAVKPGIIGSSVEFDGFNDDMSLGDVATLDFAADDNFTLAVWVQWSSEASTTITAEITGTSTHYFDSYDTGETWAVNPANMVDNNTSNYADSASSEPDIELLDGNTATDPSDGTNPVNVEIRAFGFQDTGDNGNLIIRAVFSGGDGTNNSWAIPVTTGAWSPYFNITEDTNAPISWTWTDIVNLDTDIELDRVGGADLLHVSKVEFNVGYFRAESVVIVDATSTIIAKADTTNGGYKVYLDKDGDICFGIDDDGTWTPTPDDEVCTTGIDYRDGEWHHIIAEKEGTTAIRLYVDDELIATDSSIAASATLVNTGNFYIGTNEDATNDNHHGRIDDVRVYSSLLSREDKTRLYGLGATTKIAKTLKVNPDLSRGLTTHLSFDKTSFDDLVLTASFGGDMIWATTTDPTGGSEGALDITNDGTNIYVTGDCNTNCGGASGGISHFTMKIDASNGDMLWATTTDPTASSEQPNGITSDGTDVYVTGECDGFCIGPDFGSHYTYKIDGSNGNMLWATTTEPSSSSNEAGYAITSDGTNVYVTGTADNEVCGGSGTDGCIYTYKIDGSNGDMLWATTTDPSSSSDVPYAITSMGAFIYIAAECGPDCSASGTWGYYTFKVDASNGDMIWATTTDPSGTAGDAPRGITNDGTNIYVTGYADNEVCGGSGTDKCHYTFKVDASNGDMLWATTTDPTSGNDEADAITSDGTDVYVTGNCNGCGSFGQNAHYTYKIDGSNGDMLFATTTDPTGGADNGRGITSLGAFVYVAGSCNVSCGSFGGQAYYVYKIDVTIEAGDPDGIDVFGALSRPGVIGQGIELDGINDYIDTGDRGFASSIAFWIKRDTTGAEKLINIDGTDQIEINSSNVVLATSFPGTTIIYVDGNTDSAVINDNDWHHIAITDTTGVTATTFEVGRVSTGYFDGRMDDVRVYDRVLSASEIKRLYQLGR